jgi:glycosyltransferase involved in cell wall biosynthesis
MRHALAPLHIVHGVLALDVGGLERIVLSLVRAARERRYQVTVLCVERPGTLAAEAEAEGATVLSLDKPAGRLPEFVAKAETALGAIKPDVVHTHQIGAGWYLGRATRAHGIPVVHTEQGNAMARATTTREALKTRLLFRRTARFIDLFCCVSQEIANALTRWWTVPRQKVEIVPNGVRTDPTDDGPIPAEVRVGFGIPAGAQVVGTVGRLTEVKRQDLLLRAVAVLRKSVPGLRCLLVGDGPERERLEALTRDLGLADTVHFAGYQSCPEQFLRAMDVFALTSRSEGFPVSLLEAWLAGVPAVCSAVGGIPSVLSHESDGLLFAPGDEAGLVAAIGRLLSDAALRARLAEAGRKTVCERYSLDRMADEYERRYRQVIATRAGGR